MGAIAAAPFAARAASACSFDSKSVETLPLPGSPFGIKATADGCWLFVSLTGDAKTDGAVAVLRSQRGDFRLDHVEKTGGHPAGMSLAESGRLLAVAAGDRFLLLDVVKLERADPQPLVSMIPGPANAGMIYAQFARRDRLLFVSQERQGNVAVVDVARAEQRDYAHAVLNHVVTGLAPVGLALSPDGARLYATSEIGPQASLHHCSPRPGDKPSTPEGQLFVVDVDAAATDSFKSVVAAWAAGCSPVRVALSGDGATAWVTARGDGDLLAFPTARLTGFRASTTADRRKVGASPVGLAVRPDDEQVWVANSDRFSAASPGTLTCIPSEGGVERQAATGRFPRELAFLPDGKTLVVTVFGAKALQFVPTQASGSASGACGPPQAG